MTVEILYKELTNVYGDTGNIRMLEKTLPKAKFIYTGINDKPYFANHKVDMIYMGSMPDEYVELIVEKLSEHKDKLQKAIENNTLVLFTGAALELVGSHIKENKKEIKTLGLFPDIYFERNKNKRHNSLFLGKFKNIDIVGNKNQFTLMYGKNKYPFIKADDRCVGMNLDSKDEGIHYKNFFGTYLLGPFLVLNPLFLKYILKQLKQKDDLFIEDTLMTAYKNRLEDLQREDKRFILGEHG